MTQPAFAVPEPRADDDENVAWALSTAASLLKSGDVAESLRWLRRAADSANEAGRDERALHLFRVAAELADRLPTAAVRASDRQARVPPAEAVAPTVPGPLLGHVPGGDTITDLRVIEEQTLVPGTVPAAGFTPVASAAPDTTPMALRTITVLPVSSARASQEPQSPRPLVADDETMSSMSSFRVAVLAGEDGAPRIVALAQNAEPPEGAAKAVLVATGAVDVLRIAKLLR